MSTTIKPLDIYIGGTKVFPDVNTGILAYPVYNDMYEDTQTLNSIHLSNWKNAHDWFDNNTWNKPNALVFPIMEDTNTSPWHTNSNAEDNYWHFYDSYVYDKYANYIISMPFLINQNWIGTYFIGDRAFQGLKVTELNFDPTTSYPNTIGYDNNDRTTKTLDFLYCCRMFCECRALKTINGLNLGVTRNHICNYQNDDYVYVDYLGYGVYFSPTSALNETFAGMFEHCESLTTLNITWPEALSGTNNPVLYGGCPQMFYGCRALPENQIPTFALRPIRQGDLISIDGMFSDDDQWSSHKLTNITSLHITADSWPYINNAKFAWAGTSIQSIDIPATATNLSLIQHILGESLYTPTSGDYSGNKYIIRTEKPMTDYLDDSNEEHVKLFNFGNYDGDSDFLSTFGGIYVPDNQLSDWQTYISNAGGSNIASNHVHGLSDL